MKTQLKAALLLASTMGLALPASAADYTIDTRGAHASINFKVNHLGYSFVVGRFDTFSGDFSYDQAVPEATTVNVKIDATSVNSNHAERDKHIRGSDFLAVDKFPEASFSSTKYQASGDDGGKLYGQLTLRGVTKEIVIDVTKVGEGKDPWGGYRAGFVGSTELVMKDFGIPTNLGPSSTTVAMDLVIEGIKK
ncbi:YceI family protein [Agarivorans sp. 1_MG-2023]|uniref:YceI family protein n=1 Tax=Agarivorans sp. 1_MG-2023 TaxID=3062634 RepID=UPI0026E27DE9|nr:YceI family protein [Agarivorans sp. 1_MG-2023]MDO6763668.1 YceI family protein [Agarivorans sp. 1_MG-2023]